jgi:hypothetical protein
MLLGTLLGLRPTGEDLLVRPALPAGFGVPSSGLRSAALAPSASLSTAGGAPGPLGRAGAGALRLGVAEALHGVAQTGQFPGTGRGTNRRQQQHDRMRARGRGGGETTEQPLGGLLVHPVRAHLVSLSAAPSGDVTSAPATGTGNTT